MDCILTIPTKALTKLIQEKKPIMLLNFYPNGFNPIKDRFILENRETAEIYGTIRSRKAFCCKHFLWEYLRGRKAISYMNKSFWHFLFSKKPYYVFEITDYVIFHKDSSSRKKAVQ